MRERGVEKKREILEDTEIGKEDREKGKERGRERERRRESEGEKK